jgi:flagellar motility protein MotE (MotC chaperone)
MLSKLYNLLSILSIATLLAGSGFSAFLFGTGRLSAERVKEIGAVLRGEFDQVPASQPATQPASEQSLSSAPARSIEDIQAGRQQERLRAHLLERATRDLEAQRRLLDQSLQYLLNEREQFARQRAEWDAEQKSTSSKARNEAAEKQLELFAGLPPQQAKDHIVRLWSSNRPEALALVMELDVSKTKRILAQMKTPEEEKILSELLEQLGSNEPDGDAPVSGKTTGDAAP